MFAPKPFRFTISIRDPFGTSHGPPTPSHADLGIHALEVAMSIQSVLTSILTSSEPVRDERRLEVSHRQLTEAERDLLEDGFS